MELCGLEDTSKGVTKLCSKVSWAVLVGTWETVLISELIESGLKLLVIERNAHLADRLHEDWSNQLPKDLTVSVEPIAVQAGDASWYCFNDPRLDGLLPPHTWLGEYPNLRLLNEELRSVQTLDDLIEEWKKEQAQVKDEGALLLSGRDCFSLLKGAENILKSLALILWRPTGKEGSVLSHEELEQAAGIEELMRSTFMIPDKGRYEDQLVWNHDYKRELEATNSEWCYKFDHAIAMRDEAVNIQVKIQSLMDGLALQLDETRLERDALADDKRKLELSLDAIGVSMVQIQEERDDLTKAYTEIREQAVRDQDIFKNERLQLITEKHALIADRNRIADNNRTLINELEGIKSFLTNIQEEQISLTKSRDDAYTILNIRARELESATLELDALKRATMKLITDNENLLIANGHLKAEKETHKTQLNLLMEERDDSIAENIRLRENQAFHLELTEQSEKRMETLKDLIQQIEANPKGFN